MINIYKKNLISKFVFNFLKISCVFLVLIIILNLFEEINFFKDTDAYIFLPLFLTLLNIPSVYFDILPFIFLITGMFFFIEVLEKNELVIYKVYGLTNLKIIQIIITTTFLIGVFFIIVFYNISSNFKFLYLDIKNKYSKDDKYLAVITANGLWIKDEIDRTTNFINANKLQDEYLLEVKITQFDENFDQKTIIIASEANVKNKVWDLKNVIINKNNISETKSSLKFQSNFDQEMITTFFENLSSLNLWQLHKLKKDYAKLGYDTKIINAYQHKIFSYPVYLAIMVCIACILMINIRYNKSKIFNLTIGILISVSIYYINYFFGAIIETKKISYAYSVWGPLFILALIVLTNLIKINEK